MKKTWRDCVDLAMSDLIIDQNDPEQWSQLPDVQKLFSNVSFFSHVVDANG